MLKAAAVVLFSCLVSVTTLASPARASESDPWHRDLQDARHRALAESKPLFVVFRCER
jgi:hypothetical protein